MKPLRRALAVLPLVLALAGVALAIVLVREHAIVIEGGLSQGLFCGGAGRYDCSQVASHESSRVLGIPLALWGLLFYVAMTGLALASLLLGRSGRARASSTGLLLSIAAVMFDAYLAWVMVAQIGAICLNCVATYGVNLLLALAWWTRERALAAEVDAQEPARPRWAAPAIAAFTLAGIAAAAYFSWGPISLTRQFAREEASEFLAQFQRPPVIDMSRFEGQPSRGPANAPVQIAVMGDFQCHFCRALSAHVERLEARHPERLRVWFVNAPVSSRCHPLIHSDVHEDACELAMIGECAAAAAKFWQYHDWLYKTIPHPSVNRMTAETRIAEAGLDPSAIRACVERGDAREAFARDTTILRELQLDTVPALVINGHVERGGTYPAALDAIVRALLAKR